MRFCPLLTCFIKYAAMLPFCDMYLAVLVMVRKVIMWGCLPLTGHNQQECSIGSEAAVAEQRAGKVCFDEAPPQTAIVEYPSEAAVPECTQVAALQQHTLLLILLGGILLIGLMMLLPELTAYPGNTQSRMMVTLI